MPVIMPASGSTTVGVVAAETADETTTRVPYEAVLAVVEVVSPSTVSVDRAVKPVIYAERRNPRLLAGGAAAGHAEDRRLLPEPRPVGFQKICRWS